MAGAVVSVEIQTSQARMQKAFSEYVREETFGKYGLQQIQLDCAFIAEMARSPVVCQCHAATMDPGFHQVRDFVENDDASVLDYEG